MRIFRFVIEFWDIENKKEIECKGILSAESFAGAMKRLEDYLGSDNIINVKTLFEIEDIVEDYDLESFLSEGEENGKMGI